MNEVCSQISIQQKANIGSDNGLAPSGWQAIIWTNDGLVSCRIYVTRPWYQELMYTQTLCTHHDN